MIRHFLCFSLLLTFSEFVRADLFEEASIPLFQDARHHAIQVTDGVLQKTRKLTALYQEIAVQPESANLEQRVIDLTDQFARAYADWSMTVAQESMGSTSLRVAEQEALATDFFTAMAVFSPIESNRVAELFSKALTVQMAGIVAKQKSLAQKMEVNRAGRRWSLSPLEGTVCVGVAFTIMQALHHFTGASEWVSYLSSLSGFAAFAGLLRGPLREGPSQAQQVHAIAAEANARIHNRLCSTALSGFGQFKLN